MHSAKVNNQPAQQQITDVLESSPPLQRPHSSIISAQDIHQSSLSFQKPEYQESVKDPDAQSIESTAASGTPKGNRRKSYRISLRSPPRSPRLSGLLFALQSVIGPDVEEVVEEVEEDDVADGGDIFDVDEEKSSIVGPDGVGSLDNAVQLVLGERAPSQESSTVSGLLPDLSSPLTEPSGSVLSSPEENSPVEHVTGIAVDEDL